MHRARCVTIVTTFLAKVAGGDVINVGPGESIQDAIVSAQGGDEIVVAAGVYFETIDFLGKAIAVRSSDGPAVTVIDAQQASEAVVTCNSGEGPTTLLEGFTVTNGMVGMVNEGSDPSVRDCWFSESIGALIGGGMLNDNSSPTVIGCQFSENSVIVSGGGMINLNSSPTVTNCLFTGNSANFTGGATYCEGGSPSFINCTFSGNSAVSGGSVIWAQIGTSVTMFNCVLWDNAPSDQIEGSGPPVVLYSNVQGGWFGTGNIDADPLFVNAAAGDFRLGAGSPCIDAGDNTAVPAGITTDLFGKPRFVDDPDTPDTGNPPGGGPLVDMGVHEFPACPWDCDGGSDGIVNVGDLLALLGQYDTTNPPCDDGGSCDFDDNGCVDVLDLLKLLAHYDPAGVGCP